ncbi:MAG: hypothetical protein CBB68_10645 [Rhodospirillaceae bacterium TMED8]|nr:chorismate mutase [Magnetovibrio sp.]OUT49866.1 MAG: hypothetical protein CBB68_10645 [Rhodospirillaceae bacterium TMED8]|tara:strand:+ start:951 stop:1838 length:888 start_codon:yes stop_codon:yes gene_type:complete
MSTNEEKLSGLRDEIDDIDRSIHDLIVNRTRVVEGVREIKRDAAVKIRPAREATILYRLCEEHESTFPKRELCRIWREMIVATLRFEGPFSVAVFHPEQTPGYWDLARDQYGTFTPMRRHAAARAVVEAVREQEATVGVLPFPTRDRNEPWWRFLVNDSSESPKVIARLPFIPGANTHDENLDAVVICPVPQEETGRDRSMLAVEADEDIGFPAIENALSQAGFSAVFHQLWHDPSRPPGWTYLVEVFGFLGPNTRQMARFIDGLGNRIARVLHLGGYGTPLTEGDLQSSKGKDK